MDNKTLAKLAVLAQKDPAVAEKLSKQAAAVSDDELEKVAGGDVCLLVSCIFDSSCWSDTDHTQFMKCCKSITDDSDSITYDGPIG